MDGAAFEQVYGAFQDFHAYFAPLFGRRETRDHSWNMALHSNIISHCNRVQT